VVRPRTVLNSSLPTDLAKYLEKLKAAHLGQISLIPGIWIEISLDVWANRSDLTQVAP